MKTITDFLIVGTGIAGLSYALKVADKGTVSLVTKDKIEISATQLAQGGIAAVYSETDNFSSHAEDTMVAGAHLSNPDIVDMVVKSGPDAINDLINWGVNFSRKDDTTYDLTREGGHSHRRILHAKDATGREIERALVEAVQKHPNITIYEDHIAIDLITVNKVSRQKKQQNRCIGAYIFNKQKQSVTTFGANFTILATGGAGKVYFYTCNPDIATGDGIAIGWRAGADVANMEFMQFHPTTLYHPKAKSFLISEAVRGEGGILRRSDGYAFMPDYHHLKDLAPRDIVARAIDSEMKKSGAGCVFLDITHKGEAFIKEHFPMIYETCLGFGIDMTKEAIPVVPATHYLCGGLCVDDKSETNIHNLFAIGEVACTGLHGANRLASNSLLEGIVFAKRAAEISLSRLAEQHPPNPPIPAWDCGMATDSDEEVIVAHNWDEIRRCMWNYVGIVRSDKRLQRAMNRILLIQKEIDEYYWNFHLASDLIELRNITTVARLIVESALSRHESRGLHYTINYPELDDKHFHRDTIIPGAHR